MPNSKPNIVVERRPNAEGAELVVKGGDGKIQRTSTTLVGRTG